MSAVAERTSAILADPGASDWLKHALRTALQRDLADALNDALALAEVLDARLREVLDEA